jgi:hypothetical protein
MMSQGVNPENIPAAECEHRLRTLLGKDGITAGFPRKQRDRWILLHAIASRFDPEERLSEIEATRRIGSFLLDSAPHWRIDRVNLRRALVDEGFLDREPDGSDYRRSTRHRRRVTFETAAVPGGPRTLS